jgi:hypothetical protein
MGTRWGVPFSKVEAPEAHILALLAGPRQTILSNPLDNPEARQFEYSPAKKGQKPVGWHVGARPPRGPQRPGVM